MFYYHYWILILFIIFNIINFIFLNNKKTSKKLAIIIGASSILFSVFMLLRINNEYVSYFLKYYNTDPEKLSYYLNIVKTFNITFFLTSLISTVVLFILSFKVKYKVLYTVTVILLIILYIVLFFFGQIKLMNTKCILDLGIFSECLKHYYLSLTITPLLFKNESNKVNIKD